MATSGALSSRIGERSPRSSLRFILGALKTVAVVAPYASHTGSIHFGNVPPLGIVDLQVQADAQLVCRYLGTPMAVDAAVLGSYVHRLRWKWTNLASASRISAALYQLARPKGRHVKNILDKGRYAQAVVQADQPPLVVVNQVGMPRLALPTTTTKPCILRRHI